jgi:dipeptide/tripeptide permease
MSEAPQQLSGSIVAFIYGANMGLSFLAPLIAGIVADNYGLPTALTAIAIFPMMASLICFILLVQRGS